MEPDPPPIVAGLKPPLETPAGKPFSLEAVRPTLPVKPVSGVMCTVNVCDWPGATVRKDGYTTMSKSPVCGRTVTVRTGGLGSELPAPSIRVSEAV